MNPTFFLSSTCIGISLVIGLFNWKHLNTIFRILVLQIAAAFATQTLGGIYAAYGRNNLIFFNSYLFFDLWLIGCIALLLANKLVYRAIILIALIICTLIDLGCIWRMGMSVFANWGYLSASILFTAIFLFFFVKMLVDNDSSLLIKQPYFWLCMGLLIHNGCCVPLFGFNNYLIKYHREIAAKAYYINDLLTVIRYSCMYVAIILMRKQKTEAVAIKPVNQ